MASPKVLDALKKKLLSGQYAQQYRDDLSGRTGLNYPSEVAYAVQQLALTLEKKDPESIPPEPVFECIRAAGVLGLTLMPSQSLAYIIPNGPGFKLDVSYRGIIRMFYGASNGMTRITVDVVYEGDVWEQSYSQDGPSFKHIPMYTSKTPLRAYCYAKFHSGEGFLEVMGDDDFQKVKNAARTKGTYATWEDEMRKKAVIKRASKRWPMAIADTVEQAIWQEDIDELVTGDRAEAEAAREADKAAAVAELERRAGVIDALFTDVLDYYERREAGTGDRAVRSWKKGFADKFGVPDLTALHEDQYDALADAIRARLEKVRGEHGSA